MGRIARHPSMPLLLLAIILSLGLSLCAKEFVIAPGHSFVTAEPDEAAAFLARPDQFTSAMGTLELCIRLKSAAPHTEAGYLRFAASTVLPWTQEDIDDVNVAIHKLQPKLAPIAAILPARTLLIKSTCDDEGGAAYTRGNAIILPAEFSYSATIISHELFHVITRANPGLREQLYGVIGFHHCNNIALPEQLSEKRLTNPDAFLNDFYIEAGSGTKKQPAVPVIYSSVPACDANTRETLLNCLALTFVCIEKKGDEWQPMTAGNKPVLMDADKIENLYDLVGKNTDYIIHPEEICADNFSYYVTGKKLLPSPKIPRYIYDILQKAARNRQ
jgi:hypothetical protein